MRARWRNAASSVPTFTLYGEDETATAPEFLHIEHLHSRSELHGWEIEPHTHPGLYQVVVLLDGAVEADIDGTSMRASGPAAIAIAPAVVHSFQWQPGTRGYVLTFAGALLFEAHRRPHGPRLENLFRVSEIVPLETDPDCARRLDTILGQVLEEFRRPDAGRAQMLDWLVRTVLLLLLRRQSAAALSGAENGSRNDLLTRFRELIEQHYREHWSVPAYAEALNLTEGRLNRICRALAQKSAFELIQERLLLEARRRLVYIDAPVALLAYDLGFQDPAYFCRFFKRMTGMTPRDFRRSPGGATSS